MAKYFGKRGWFFLLVILAFALIISSLFKKVLNKLPHEGFTQDSPFVSKRNNEIYDSYYAMIYDDIFRPKPRVEYEYKTILDMTSPTTENSVFLDVGSGTGSLVSSLTNQGYEAYGIDKSKAMVDVSQIKYQDLQVKCGDALDSMSFDRGTFTHITCMNFTIYEIADKPTFFRNCFYWLKPNGYLILHLADRDKYSPVVPASVPSMIDNPQKYVEKRITESMIDFYDFSYKNSAKFDKPGEVHIAETFKDSKNGNVRQNEITLYMGNVRDILYMAQQSGFVLHSQTTMKKDDYQYIFILERVQ